jgi:hypothetical protein
MFSKTITKKVLIKEKDTTLCLEGIHDRAPRETVCWALRKAGVEERLVEWVMW